MMLQNQEGSQLILKDRIGKNTFSALVKAY